MNKCGKVYDVIYIVLPSYTFPLLFIDTVLPSYTFPPLLIDTVIPFYTFPLLLILYL
jgi:hypothetical protein